ncbi:MAG: hypothetical protein OXN79_00075 [bacterium]|nr:hypothetical protein [bacterium]
MQGELDQAQMNRAAYESDHRVRLERDDRGRIALMHDGHLDGVYADLETANIAGYEQFGEGEFSLIRIGRDFADFGAMNRSVG